MTTRSSSTDCILVLNCGSSSIKFAVFDANASDPSRAPGWHGKITGIGSAGAALTTSDGDNLSLRLDVHQSSHRALQTIVAHARDWLGARRLVAVAHRVVHGGARFVAPCLISPPVLEQLRRLIPLAPLHQPFALDAIDLLLADLPGVDQVACFDTAFHHELPEVEQWLPLPRRFRDHGMRRYGFHGLSYDYMSVALPERHGERAHGKVIVAHLGSGASLCAMKELKSAATTMGFSALDGVMMGTRSGAVDPGALLYLMEVEQLTPQALGAMLYHDSGLLGVSGLSSDPRELLERESDDPAAAMALALYVRRIVREVGALVAVLGGLDLLVFTAGIGEHSAVLRGRICQALAFLNIRLDTSANRCHAPVISSADSAVTVGVEPTNEEWIAARAAWRLRWASNGDLDEPYPA